MDVQLSSDESAAVAKALRSYLSDLRMEITDTDNPGYKRDLRDEREALESAVRKLDEALGRSTDVGGASVTVVELWWTTLE